MSWQDPIAAIMRIHLTVCRNRRANDTFDFFLPERVKLEGLSQSVNMCDINICMANWSEAGFIILALARVQVRRRMIWNRTQLCRYRWIQQWGTSQLDTVNNGC